MIFYFRIDIICHLKLVRDIRFRLEKVLFLCLSGPCVKLYSLLCKLFCNFCVQPLYADRLIAIFCIGLEYVFLGGEGVAQNIKTFKAIYSVVGMVCVWWIS